MRREVKQEFRAHGKLLLSGEYLVLKGAESLAIPLRLGQTLRVTTYPGDHRHVLNWKAFAPSSLWFEASYSLPDLDLLSSTDQSKAIRLQMILLTLRQLRPGLFEGERSHNIETQLDFEPDWGLGSSSTLVSNLAQWAAVDPYTLLNLSMGGSGYDIACAAADGPVFYRLNNLRPVVRQAAFAPDFAGHIYFVYSGRKQRSEEGIRTFNQLYEHTDLSGAVASVSQLSRRMVAAIDFEDFCSIVGRHEELLSGLLLRKPVADDFPDFQGHLKSLGAWGGDFLMALSLRPEEEVRSYFAAKEMPIVFTYNQLALKTIQP
jgi:mevalonate kinase